MYTPFRLPLLTILLWLTTSTIQVDIVITLESGGAIACTEARPGDCCAVPIRRNGADGTVARLGDTQGRPRLELAVATAVVIDNLLVNDIAGLFKAAPPKFACDNTPPHKRYGGPGYIRHLNTENAPISGAGYIRLPRKYPDPTDPAAQEQLAASTLLGIKRKRRDGGTDPMTAPGVDPKRLFGQSGSGLAKLKRDIILLAGVEQAEAYIAPLRTRYPDKYTDEKGVVYKSDNTTQTVVKDSNGNMLDLATFEIVT
ncbi:MAG: hypothetical protein Q9168_007935 [Polycauliona sp. 1 TL-2023]